MISVAKALIVVLTGLLIFILMLLFGPPSLGELLFPEWCRYILSLVFLLIFFGSAAIVSYRCGLSYAKEEIRCFRLTPLHSLAKRKACYFVTSVSAVMFSLTILVAVDYLLVYGDSVEVDALLKSKHRGNITKDIASTAQRIELDDAGRQAFKLAGHDATSSLEKSKVYLWHLLVTGFPQRSVYSILDSSAFNPKLATTPPGTDELKRRACWFGSLDEIEEARVWQSYQTELPEVSELFFDTLREDYLAKLPMHYDFLRSVYSGGLNLAVIAVGVFAFSWTLCLHKDFLQTNRFGSVSIVSNAPLQEVDRTYLENLNRESKELIWSELTNKKGWIRLLPFWDLYQFKTQEKSVCAILLIHFLNGYHRRNIDPLTTVKTENDGQQQGELKKEADYNDVCLHSKEFAWKEWLSSEELSPTFSNATSHWPERMTELGFLGTVIGLMLSMGTLAMTQVPSDDPLYSSVAVGKMGAELKLCFSTTFWGLVFAIAIRESITRCRAKENSEVREVIDNFDKILKTNRNNIS